MADSDGRREARRRKILENAQSRLEKITGRKEDISLENKNANNVDSGLIGDTSSSAFSSLTREINGIIRNLPVEEISSILQNVDTSRMQSSPTTSNLSGESIRHSISTLLNSKSQENEAQEQIQTKPFQLNKIFIVMLAVLVRLLHYLHITELFSNIIFIPLLLIEIVEITFSTEPVESISMISATLLLCGLTPGVVKTLTKFLAAVTKLALDFSIFLFTFVLTDVLFSNLEMYLTSNNY